MHMFVDSIISLRERDEELSLFFLGKKLIFGNTMKYNENLVYFAHWSFFSVRDNIFNQKYYIFGFIKK